MRRANTATRQRNGANCWPEHIGTTDAGCCGACSGAKIGNILIGAIEGVRRTHRSSNQPWTLTLVLRLLLRKLGRPLRHDLRLVELRDALAAVGNALLHGLTDIANGGSGPG